jgi:hypothetical protein
MLRSLLNTSERAAFLNKIELVLPSCKIEIENLIARLRFDNYGLLFNPRSTEQVDLNEGFDKYKILILGTEWVIEEEGSLPSKKFNLATTHPRMVNPNGTGQYFTLFNITLKKIPKHDNNGQSFLGAIKIVSVIEPSNSMRVSFWWMNRMLPRT